jgi:hypothetical protein
LKVFRGKVLKRRPKKKKELENYLNDCKPKIEAYAIGKIVENELSHETQALVNQGLIKQRDINSIKRQISNKIFKGENNLASAIE